MASLAEGHRFQAVRNTGSPEELELLGYSIGRTWARPAAAMPDAWSGDSPGPPAADPEPLPEPARSWIDGARRFAYGEHAGDAGGHDPFHVERVWHMARRLAGTSPLADRVVVELAALLHDVDDWKRAPPADGVAGGRTGRWLSGAGVPEALSRQVLETIAQVSFLGVGQPRPVTPEAHVVQDADRLDALGAVGIARLFAFGGSRGRPLHDPGIPPAPGEDAAAARGRRSTSLNHIYEKILHLRDLLNTDPARCLGAGRHRFVEEFLARFLDEWEGRR
ncbi:MAG: phosphohydrolase [Deltaproteobacteria bacterium]|nr:phosphohydrolase [Deltaproteobacteria bacterium]